MDTQPYKGARDFYPQDMRLRQFWADACRSVAELFGYEPYDGPMLERQELYETKTSEEIVNEQTYAFQDRGGRKVVIRPEMTPTFARMIAAKAGALTFPLRWYCLPNVWRYERPQRGRVREHWQLNCDLVALEITPAYEFEMFRLIFTLMKRFGATPSDFVIRYNHRGLCDQLFRKQFKIDDPQKRRNVFYLLDRMNKLPPDTLSDVAKDKGVGQFPEIRSFLESCKSPDQAFKHLSDEVECQAFLQFAQLLYGSEVNQSAKFDPTIVRGFEYYTGLVFELEDTHPDNHRALLGGGRYDNLIGLFSNQNLQGIGFALGDVTFRDFLEVHQLIPKAEQGRDTCVILASEDVMNYASSVQDQLIQAGIPSRMVVSPPDKMFKSGLKNALRYGSQYMLIVGQQEQKTRQVVMKDIAGRKDTPLSVEKTITILTAQ